jgi:hypothetical protein
MAEGLQVVETQQQHRRFSSTLKVIDGQRHPCLQAPKSAQRSRMNHSLESFSLRELMLGYFSERDRAM